jgi:hypothetical protein
MLDMLPAYLVSWENPNNTPVPSLARPLRLCYEPQLKVRRQGLGARVARRAAARPLLVGDRTEQAFAGD